MKLFYHLPLSFTAVCVCACVRAVVVLTHAGYVNMAHG